MGADDGPVLSLASRRLVNRDPGYNLPLMSLITRCPACGTMFKVVPDQLKISEGWVRCGQCAEIFDATASLQRPQAPLFAPK